MNHWMERPFEPDQIMTTDKGYWSVHVSMSSGNCMKRKTRDSDRTTNRCETRQQHSMCDKGLEDLSQASVISLQHFDNMLSLGARHADTTFATQSWAFTANKSLSHSCPLMSANLVYALIEDGQCNSTCSSSSTAGLQALHPLTCSACTLSFSYLASESADYGSKAWSC